MLYDYHIDPNTPMFPPDWHYPLSHFTWEIETIYSILREGFRVSYCVENLTDTERTITAAFPMVSFCCMRMDEAKERMRSYGPKIISMKTAWGERNGLNPVSYLEKHSSFASDVISGFDHIAGVSSTLVESAIFRSPLGIEKKYISLLISYFSYTKNFYAPLVRRGELVQEKYGFGLEREWRYVLKDPKYPLFLLKDDIKRKRHFNAQIANEKLRFQPEDIEEIFVETESQREKVLDIIRNELHYNINPALVRINDIRHSSEWDG